MTSIRNQLMYYFEKKLSAKRVKRRPRKKSKRRTEKPMEIASPFRELEVEGGRFGYVDSDRDSCVVVGSQLGCNFEMMGHFSEALSERGISSMVMDYNGLRKNEEGTLNISQIVEDMESVLEIANKRYEKVYLVGSCFGADVVYVSATETDQNLRGLFLHAPMAPFCGKLLKRYFPKTNVMKNALGCNVARILRKTNTIALSEIIGKDLGEGSINNILFEKSQIRKYLNEQPKDKKLDFPIVVIGGTCDKVVSWKHSGLVARTLGEKHEDVSFKKLDISHYGLRDRDESLVDFISERIL